MNVVLPAAVDAMARTQTVIEHQPYIDATTQPAMIKANLPAEPLATPNQLENDFSHTSLATFLEKYGILRDQDFTLSQHILTERKMERRHFLLKM